MIDFKISSVKDSRNPEVRHIKCPEKFQSHTRDDGVMHHETIPGTAKMKKGSRPLARQRRDRFQIQKCEIFHVPRGIDPTQWTMGLGPRDQP